MDYWAGPLGRTATFTLKNAKGQRFGRVVGELAGDEPKSLPGSVNGNPGYEVITANGIIEVIEHRAMEPIFYISDDPEVKRQLGVL